ncbi:E3 ubiquitin-protein ligase BRE1 KNAG_0D04450 [Huiozyma naganishii CBS 8797]|uniref:E3 ubiquitin protein ligase n=1 Tax=Huiozyma naganishii (strain ATCC MYA-139 / BCRC 22969 / CBS 8797 / KCTC 17520 / NBRC 10181 / NCYC 3082 / Yp74L-3) TaxID=1071383 RepID=J7R5Q7_HUIN7|nr:hypothetical protein KNAG_0D04450 [Kazachstania naganishii CBS 8797]CCK70190.1 hypothetical protein KNAG_0D04450 [Kazachstania naganishii CBS 8797]
MSVEPAAKKPKLELSDPSEPLTQSDVVAFQKEALFRCLNQRRNEYNYLHERYEVSKKSYMEISMKLANIIALVVTLAKFLEYSLTDENDKSICNKLAEGDENLIVQMSDSFMKILTKFVAGKGEESLEYEKLISFTKELKILQQSKIELTNENTKLVAEIRQLKQFYENLIKKYDREDSLTVKRIFEKRDGEAADEENNASESNSAVERTNSPENLAVKQEQNNGESLKAGTENIASDPHVEGNADLADEYETKIAKLQNELESLRLVVDELEKIKILNRDKISTLETDLMGYKNVNHDDDIKVERDSWQNKVVLLSKENQELKGINDSFLSKFQALCTEKEIFNNQLTKEYQENAEKFKTQITTLEKDLVRIRTVRDELLSKIAILESEKSKSELIEDIKKSLELSRATWENLCENRKLENPSQDLLMKEIQDMEKAFKSLNELNSKKYNDLINHESVISKLTVEKTKADQKYFAAMRSKDSILIENKNLSKTLGKTNELIVQLKDAEKLLQQKIDVLHRQLKLSQANEKRLIDSNKSESLKIIELNSQINKLEKLTQYYKDENVNLLGETNRLQSAKERFEISNKTLELKASQNDQTITKLEERLKARRAGALESDEPLAEELENFRTLVYCSLCSKNWKNMAIKTCGHVFCDSCCKERLAARMRKCPTCNNPFASGDLIPIHL